MAVVMFGHCVFFMVVVLLTGCQCMYVSPITIEILPDEHTNWEAFRGVNVNISCLVGADHHPITNITKLLLFKDDGDPVVRLQNDSQITHVFADDTVKGQIDPTCGQGFLQLTIISPKPTDTGSYTCGMSYLDQSGEMRKGSARKTLYVGLYGQPEDGYIDIVKKLTMYINIVICTIGIPGNIICLLVWIQKDMITSSGFYLAVLAFNDLSYMCLRLTHHLYWNIYGFNYSGWCRIHYILLFFFRNLSSPLALCFTVERYIAICYPFKRVVYCTVRRAKIVVAWMAMFIFIINLPVGFFFSHHHKGGGCQIRALNFDSTLSATFTYHTLQEYLINVVVNIAIAIFNVLVIVKLRQDSAHYLQRTGRYNRTSIPRSRIDQTAATSMLLGISFYQVIATLPTSIALALCYHYYARLINLDVTKEVFKAEARMYMEFYLFKACSIWLDTTHYAFDILIYVVTSKTFRQTLKRIVLSCRRS